MTKIIVLIITSAFAAGCGPAAPDDESLGAREDESTVCADGATVQGIDVSHWQGKVDWAKVKGAGFAFGVAKATEGTGFVDPEFDANWSGMAKAGLIRGAYHFFRASDDAKAQAKVFTDTVGAIGDGDLPLVLDLESDDGESKATVIARAKTFLAEVENLSGRKPMLYSGYFFKSLGSPAGFSDHPLWVPQYGPACPDIPEAGWESWTIFQYTDSKSVPGVSGGCDADQFNGSLADLKALAQSPNVAAKGKLERADCTGAAGWAQDPDAPKKAAAVRIFADGGPAKGELALELTANVDRQDLCAELGSCKHGFEAALPAKLLDGEEHVLRAYAVDLETGDLAALAGNPKSITCAPPTEGSSGSGGGTGVGGGGVAPLAAEPAEDDVEESGGCAIPAGSRGSGSAPIALLALSISAWLTTRRARGRARR